MGTRHLTLVFYNGTWHIAQYGQWDGYPSGQGVTILRFLTDPTNLSKLRTVLNDAANMLYTPTKEQLDAWHAAMARERQAHYERGRDLVDEAEIKQWAAMDFPGRDVCPSISRDTGAGILEVVANATEPVPVVRDLEFLADGLFCEWAYVVDLDEGVVEVYSNWDGLKVIKYGGEVRFVGDESFKDMGSFPALVGKWSFCELPDEATFVESLKRVGDDE